MKLVTLKNQENKQTSIDHISGFTITSAITGLLVTESNEVESSEHWPQTSVHDDEWFDEYMNKHCRVSVSQTDLGDCIRVNSSDADVFGIRGFVVTVGIVYTKNIHVFEGGRRVGNDIAEKAVYTELEVVIPHHNFFGSEGVDSAHNVIKGLGFNYLARAERIEEMNANDLVEQRAQEAEIEPSSNAGFNMWQQRQIYPTAGDQVEPSINDVTDYTQFYLGGDHFLINIDSNSTEMVALGVLKLELRRTVSKKVKRAYRDIANIIDLDEKMTVINIANGRALTFFAISIVNPDSLTSDKINFTILPSTQDFHGIGEFYKSCTYFKERLKIASDEANFEINTTLHYVGGDGQVHVETDTFKKESKGPIKTYERFSAALPTHMSKIAVIAEIIETSTRESISSVMELLSFGKAPNGIGFESNYANKIKNYFEATINMGAGNITFMVASPDFMYSFNKPSTQSLYREFQDNITRRVFSFASKTKSKATVRSIYVDSTGVHNDINSYCPETDTVEGAMNLIGHGVPAFAQEIANGVADSKLTKFVPGVIETKYSLHPQCPEVTEVYISEDSKRLLELINHKHMCVKDARGIKGDEGATFFAQGRTKFNIKDAKHWVSAITIPERSSLDNIQLDLSEKKYAAKFYLLVEVSIEGRVQKMVISIPIRASQLTTDDAKLQYFTTWAEQITQFLKEAIFIATVSVVQYGGITMVSMETGVKA